MVGLIIPKRGLRQGDPLSPYLFLLCVEGLSNILDRAINSGDLHGYRIAPSAPSVSHLLFADDSFLFFKGTTEEAHKIKSILSLYEKWSGQSVNYLKSGVFFSANISVEISKLKSPISLVFTMVSLIQIIWDSLP